MNKFETLKKFLEDFNEYSEIEAIDIFRIVKDFGIKIITNSFGNNEILGTRGNPLGIEIIYIKDNLASKEERFILAHEFCHFLLKEKSFNMGILKVRNNEEIRADDFATDLLLPSKSLIKAYNEYQNIPTLSDIFGVPEKVVEYKLNKLCKEKEINFCF